MNDKDQIETKIDISGKAFKKYFLNTSFLLVEKIVRLIISFFVGVLVVRYLGPDRNGMLAVAVSAVGILIALSTLGVRGILVRELVKDESKRDLFLGTAFYLKVSISIMITLGVLLYYYFVPNLQSLLVLIISATILFQTFNVIEFYFQAKVISKFTVYSKFISVFISNIFKVYLILQDASLVYFAIAYSVEFFLLSWGYVFFLHKNGVHIRKWNINKTVVFSLLKDSWPLMFSSIASTVYLKIDKIILMVMMEKTSVGVYDAATRICEALYFIPVVITSSLFPAIIKAREKNVEFFNNRMQKLYDLMAWLAIGVAIPISYFGSDIIQLLFKEKFIEAGPVLSLYIWASIPIFFYVANSQYLITENFTKIYFTRSILGMVLNIILNIYLIPIYGINGAAYATLISYSVATFSIVLMPKTRKQFFMMLKSMLLINFPKFVFQKLKR